MNILLLEEDELVLPARDRRARHVRKVLKLGKGDTLVAGIVNGPSGTARIEEINDLQLRVSFVPDPPTEPPPGSSLRRVDLLLGHPRPIVLKRMLRDLCTIGVDRIVVVPTELGEKSYYHAGMWNDVRPYLRVGAEQAGLTRLTEVIRCSSLAEGLARTDHPGALHFVLHPAHGTTLARALAEHVAGVPAAPAPAGIVVAVGSERGWTDAELQLLGEANYLYADLGKRTLRTETAALVACWLARSVL